MDRDHDSDYGNEPQNDPIVRHSFPETTALYRAAAAGWLDVVQLLCDWGADPSTRDGYNGSLGDPILFKVIGNGDEGISRMLLEYGAKLIRCDDRSVLHVASSQPKINLVRLVLDYGAMIESKDSLHQTPLYLATCGGFAKSVQLLLEEGAQANAMTAEGRTALYKAGGNERPDIAKLLLQYGADPALGRGRYGETTIYKAAWYNDLETVDLLLDFELDVNMPNDEKMHKYSSVGEKVLHGVLGGLSKDHALMNAWGKTALHAAAYRGHADMVSLLLEEGADLEMKGKDGETALYLAAEQKHERTVQILLKAGAKLETEKHDPVLSLINERQNKRGEKVKDVVKTSGSGVGTDMARIGTGDPVVSLVADIAKAWSKSRRARK